MIVASILNHLLAVHTHNAIDKHYHFIYDANGNKRTSIVVGCRAYRISLLSRAAAIRQLITAEYLRCVVLPCQSFVNECRISNHGLYHSRALLFVIIIIILQSRTWSIIMWLIDISIRMFCGYVSKMFSLFGHGTRIVPQNIVPLTKAWLYWFPEKTEIFT